jgi:hypothetical protein
VARSSRSAKVAPSDTTSCVSRVAGVSIRGKNTSLSVPLLSVYQTLLPLVREVPNPSLSPGDQVEAAPGAPGAGGAATAGVGTATPANAASRAPTVSRATPRRVRLPAGTRRGA